MTLFAFNHSRPIALFAIAGLALALTSTPTVAAINLELRPLNQVVFVGDTIDVGLYAVSDDPSVQNSAAIEAILNWNIGFMQLLAADQTGATPFLAAGFLPDSYNLNTSLADGDAMFIGLAPFSGTIPSTPAGTLLSTFQFLALAPTPATPVDIPAFGGSPVGATVVYDGTIPNFSVTGTLTGASITILAIPAPGAVVMLGLAMLGTRRRRLG